MNNYTETQSLYRGDIFSSVLFSSVLGGLNREVVCLGRSIV